MIRAIIRKISYFFLVLITISPILALNLGQSAIPKSTFGTLDTSHSYVQCDSPSISFENLANLTIDLWINILVFTEGGHTILAKGYTTSSSTSVNYALRYSCYQGTNYIEFYYYSSNGWVIWRSDPDPLNAGSWHNVAITTTFGSSALKVIVDGASIKGSWISGEGTESPCLTADPLWIGRINSSVGDPLGEPSDGLITEFCIYNKILDSQEISYNSLNPSSPLHDSLVLWLDFGDSNGSVVQDKSGHQSNVFVYGSAIDSLSGGCVQFLYFRPQILLFNFFGFAFLIDATTLIPIITSLFVIFATMRLRAIAIQTRPLVFRFVKSKFTRIGLMSTFLLSIVLLVLVFVNSVYSANFIQTMLYETVLLLLFFTVILNIRNVFKV